MPATTDRSILTVILRISAWSCPKGPVRSTGPFSCPPIPSGLPGTEFNQLSHQFRRQLIAIAKRLAPIPRRIFGLQIPPPLESTSRRRYHRNQRWFHQNSARLDPVPADNLFQIGNRIPAQDHPLNDPINRPARYERGLLFWEHTRHMFMMSR